MLKHLILLMSMLFAAVVQAGDIKREAEISEAIGKTLSFGKAVRLEAGGTDFLSLYAETEKTASKGTVILLHDTGGHPDQQAVIYQLRRLLPMHNWGALSLQMPLREAGAGMEEYYSLFPEALARIQAGVKYAKDKGAQNIVLAGYGLGALQAVYAQSQQPLEIKAIAAISLPVPAACAASVMPDVANTGAQAAPGAVATGSCNAPQTLAWLKNIKIPVLDVYGALDVSDVTGTARDRRLAAKENTGYRQLEINDEGHQYLHDEGLLGKRVVSWLARVAGK